MSQVKFVWDIMRRLKPIAVRGYRRNSRARKILLLLTTIGRKSGLRRVTPLQYERVGETIFIAAARGANADWYRNLLTDPDVEVELPAGRFRGHAVPIRDACRVVDFLELRLQRHPWMVRVMLIMHGIVRSPRRADLERLGQEIALVEVRDLERMQAACAEAE
jgi:deazaflavin-dependent oxidoreductase (nitroreductase family)